MQLCFFQNLSSLNRCQTVSFSTCRMNLASHFDELDHFRLDDRRNAVAARTHPRAIDLVAAVDERDRSDHRAAIRCIQMQFFAERIEQHLDVFNDRVAFVLIVERVFLGAFDRVLEHVEHTAQARRLALRQQLLGAARHQHRPHVGLGLRQVEQLPPVRARCPFR